MPKDFEPRKSNLDRAVERLIARLESGDEALSRRIFQTLEIDGEVRPSMDQIKEFLTTEREARRNARKRP